jgi:fatty acid CoA ligase FadD9
MLGVTSIDYTTVDMALLRLGAIAVPLQTGASLGQLRPIAAETEPVVIASGVDFLDDAVELMLSGHLPERLVVFDYRVEVDDHRDALAAATSRRWPTYSPAAMRCRRHRGPSAMTTHWAC